MANVPSIRDMFPDFNDVFSPAFNDFLGVSNYPKVDLVEKDEGYKLTADMPGCDKEDTTVEYSDNTLTISANHESHTEEEKEDGRYVRKERNMVSYKRSFYLPDVDEDKITGTFKNGVLKLELPKTEHHKKETKKIELN
ncbi:MULTISPECIES: Hsp20/alpha crystallin family protein [unclassified Enterococcus]|uniref:Hsp20/alpha crystallin family protein n=1 Tax=unclassified Enterococcus TaxID=2608891 RepID=UPI0013EA3DAB|nr:MULTISPECIES: Hsp20/alpha crystallin family protein [unclassified Enterococcus]